MSWWRAPKAELPRRLIWLTLAVVGPSALTAVLVALSIGNTRDYVFLYLGLVAVLGLASGFVETLVAATCSFLLVDFFFVRPVHTLQFADTPDLVNLAIFAGTAVVVGAFGHRVARLGETERQVRALEQTERLRRELLANVSHELRTPMGSILTGTTTLLRRHALPDDVRPEVESLATEARRLDRLVSDLLDMTRIEAGIVDLRPAEVDVTEAVDASIRRLHRKHPERRVTVDAPPSLADAYADWQRVAQVLDNLLENAERASPASGDIRVSLAQRDGELTVRVIDSGPGVPESMRAHVFQRFFRGDRSDDGGMGLGLPIVRGLIEAQGGRVWLEDRREGAGAVFGFSLPVADEEASVTS